ncbi:hypothetical protein HDU99_008009, partial [Rhizoclosmatium hyalinum]
MGKKVDIIGAGSSGAVTAIALKRQGFEDRITKNHTKAGEMDAIAVLRSKLHHTLMQAVGNAGIKSYGGKKIMDLVQTNDDVTVHFEDGSNVIADFVVGADGIHSITRRLLFPEAAKPEVVGTGYVGVVDL